MDVQQSGPVEIVYHLPMSKAKQDYYRAHGDQTAEGRRTDDLPPNSQVRALTADPEEW